MEEKDFKKDFYERVLKPLQEMCSLLGIKFNITYLNEDYTTIINVVLFYTGYNKIKDNENLSDTYCNQMEISYKKLLEFYENFVKEIFGTNIKENDDIHFYRVSDMNFNTAIFFSGDNYDGFNITYTDE